MVKARVRQDAVDQEIEQSQKHKPWHRYLEASLGLRNHWYPAIRDELLTNRRRTKEGAWPSNICNEYGTAMACIVLQMPNNYLPIFQR